MKVTDKKPFLILLIIMTYLSTFSQEDSIRFAFADPKATIFNYSTEALITDRPDATESPNVMPKGVLQVETGAFYESFEDNDIKSENFTVDRSPDISGKDIQSIY